MRLTRAARTVLCWVASRDCHEEGAAALVSGLRLHSLWGPRDLREPDRRRALGDRPRLDPDPREGMEEMETVERRLRVAKRAPDRAATSVPPLIRRPPTQAPLLGGGPASAAEGLESHVENDRLIREGLL